MRTKTIATLLLLTLSSSQAQEKAPTDLPKFAQTQPAIDKTITQQDIQNMIQNSQQMITGIVENLNKSTAQMLVNQRSRKLPITIITTQAAVQQNRIFAELVKYGIKVYYVPHKNSKKMLIKESMLINENTILTGPMLYGKTGKSIMIQNDYTTPALIRQRLNQILKETTLYKP